MTLTCPNHGSVEPRLAWFRSDGNNLHLGGLCPQDNLVLKWLPRDTKGAPSKEIVYLIGRPVPKRIHRIEALR